MLAAPPNARAGSIADTRHNLSALATHGGIKAVTEERICVFCHTPHTSLLEYSSEPGLKFPLWNHKLKDIVTYILPDDDPGSIPLLSRPQNPPDGDSRLCLSCHDGSIAIGDVYNPGFSPPRVITMEGPGLVGGKIDLNTSGFVGPGLDMTGHHPVSIVVNSALISDLSSRCTSEGTSFTVMSTPLSPVRYRPTLNEYPPTGGSSGNGVQCTSCHDPHDDANGMFLRTGAPGAAQPLCNGCHVLCP